MGRVLVVDDDPGQLELRQTILEAAGLDVLTACDPAQAISIAEQQRPRSVVLDLCLPSERDGIGLLRQLRNLAGPEEMRILILSGWTANFRALPEAALADHILQKPFPTRDLVRLVNGD